MATMICPECGEEINVSTKRIGDLIECPECDEEIFVSEDELDGFEDTEDDEDGEVGE